MITSKDAKQEMLNTRKVIQDEKASVDTKVQAVEKLVEVVLKVVLSNRTNVVRLMEAKGVDKLAPRKREEVEKKVEEKE